jgi:hypothetical protein
MASCRVRLGVALLTLAVVACRGVAGGSWVGRVVAGVSRTLSAPHTLAWRGTGAEQQRNTAAPATADGAWQPGHGEITSLPGYDGPFPSKHYGGYVAVGGRRQVCAVPRSSMCMDARAAGAHTIDAHLVAPRPHQHCTPQPCCAAASCLSPGRGGACRLCLLPHTTAAHCRCGCVCDCVCVCVCVCACMGVHTRSSTTTWSRASGIWPTTQSCCGSMAGLAAPRSMAGCTSRCVRVGVCWGGGGGGGGMLSGGCSSQCNRHPPFLRRDITAG